MEGDIYHLITVEVCRCANCNSTLREPYEGITRRQLSDGQVLVMRRTRCRNCQTKRIERSIESGRNEPATTVAIADSRRNVKSNLDPSVGDLSRDLSWKHRVQSARQRPDGSPRNRRLATDGSESNQTKDEG